MKTPTRRASPRAWDAWTSAFLLSTVIGAGVVVAALAPF